MKAFAIGAAMMLVAANGAAAQNACWTYTTTLYGGSPGMCTSIEPEWPCR